MNEDDPDVPIMEIAVCNEHLTQINAGADWFYDGADHMIHMGRDVAPRITDFQIREGIDPLSTLIVHSVSDGAPRIDEYRLSRPQLDQLAALIRGEQEWWNITKDDEGDSPASESPEP